MSAKILALDIETTPALLWGYGLFNQNFGIHQIERPPEMIGWATRWDDQPASSCAWEDPTRDGLEKLWHQLDEATHVLHFNGKTFDMPWINHEFVKHGIMGGKPPSPYKQIDLMKQIRGQVRSISNKLAFLSTDLLGFEGKIEANALTLWLEMYRAEQRGDTAAYLKARGKMIRYCKQDVNLLPKMKRKYLPWMTGINANLYSGNLDGCPNCGGSRLERRGYAHTAAGAYQRYRCNTCGTWSRGNRSLEMTTTRNYR